MIQFSSRLASLCSISRNVSRLFDFKPSTGVRVDLTQITSIGSEKKV